MSKQLAGLTNFFNVFEKPWKSHENPPGVVQGRAYFLTNYVLNIY